MQNRLSVGVAALLLTLVASSTHIATAGEPGRLAAFAARQDLCDQISLAMADGQIDRAERYTILLNAKPILKPDEYESFKHTMNRVSPPVPVAKHSTKSRKLPTLAQKKVPPAATPSMATTILTEAQAEVEEAPLPNRVAFLDDVR